MMAPEQAFELFHRQAKAFRRIPVATDRLQLERTFTFADAREIVPYLNALGVTDCYLSPFFRANTADSQSIVTALTHLPPQTEADPRRLAERHRERVRED
jgi:glycosidase